MHALMLGLACMCRERDTLNVASLQMYGNHHAYQPLQGPGGTHPCRKMKWRALPAQECLEQNRLQQHKLSLVSLQFLACMCKMMLLTHGNRNKLWTGFKAHDGECSVHCVCFVFRSFMCRTEVVCHDFQLRIVLAFFSCTDDVTCSAF